MVNAVFKVVIFGDGGVGKTTLTQKFVSGIFMDDTKMTIGAQFHVKTLDLEGKKVALQIWDFAGERQFRFMLPSYLRGSAGAIFMYDTTRYSSLKNLDDWLQVLTSENDTLHHIPVLMIGGKSDLIDKRSVDKEFASELAIEKGFSAVYECSSKTGENVDVIFHQLTQTMLHNSERQQEKTILTSSIY